MDLKQIQAETEKYQAEIMKIQSKYMADPTPENMMKMQQEMAVISQKMSELSAEYMAVAAKDMTARQQEIAASAYAQAGGDIDVSGLIEDDEKEKAQFVKDHPAPQDKAKYLPLGALLLYTNDEPYQTFALMDGQEEWRDAMKEGWGLKNAEGGKKMLASLLEGRHEAALGEDYRNFKAGKPHKLSREDVEGYEETLENLQEYLPALLPYAQKCSSLLAWDLDRACYLARIFVHLGWISDSESFDWIAKVAVKIKAGFASWEEYFASILVGRSVHMGYDDVMIGAAYDLLVDNKAFLDGHPISAL
jgi:hypothetical protein